MRKPIATVLLGSLLALYLTQGLALANTRSRVGVTWKDTLKFIDERDFSVTSSIDIPKGESWTYWHSTDGGRLYLINTGKGLAKLASIDLKEDSLIETKDLGYSCSGALIPEDNDRAYAFFAGNKKHSPSVMALSRDGAKIIARKKLAHAPDFAQALGVERDLVLTYRDVEKKARIEILRSANLETRASIDFSGSIAMTFLNRVHQYHYVVAGAPDLPAASRLGRLLIIDGNTWEVDRELSIKIDSRPFWDEETGQLYVLAPPNEESQTGALLKVVTGNKVEEILSLTDLPAAITLMEGKKGLLVLAQREVLIVAQDGSGVKARIPLRKKPVAILESPQSDTAYVAHSNSHHVTVINTEKGSVLGLLKVGRGSVRFWTVVARGIGSLTLNPYILSNPISPAEEVDGFFSPSGDKAYFLNSKTDDVTIVDTASNTILDKLRGGQFAQLVSDGKYLSTIGSTRFRLFDATTHDLLSSVQVPPGTTLTLGLDETYGYLNTVNPQVRVVEFEGRRGLKKIIKGRLISFP